MCVLCVLCVCVCVCVCVFVRVCACCVEGMLGIHAIIHTILVYSLHILVYFGYSLQHVVGYQSAYSYFSDHCIRTIYFSFHYLKSTVTLSFNISIAAGMRPQWLNALLHVMPVTIDTTQSPKHVDAKVRTPCYIALARHPSRHILPSRSTNMQLCSIHNACISLMCVAMYLNVELCSFLWGEKGVVWKMGSSRWGGGALGQVCG